MSFMDESSKALKACSYTTKFTIIYAINKTSSNTDRCVQLWSSSFMRPLSKAQVLKGDLKRRSQKEGLEGGLRRGS